MIYVVATLTIKPGSLDDVMAAVRPCIEATRQEEGCLSYDIHQSLTQDDTLVYVERWRDMDAIRAHFEMGHMATMRKAVADHITGTKIEIITPERVKEL